MIRGLSVAGLAAVLAAFLLPGPAYAPPFCAATDEMLAALTGRYGERVVGAGLTVGGELLQVLVRPDGRSWTVLVTTPDGVSCLLAVGRDWQAVVAGWSFRGVFPGVILAVADHGAARADLEMDPLPRTLAGPGQTSPG